MAGKRGGARPGSGRKPGKRNVVAGPKTRKVIADLIASGDETPLEVMLLIMKNAVKQKKWNTAMHAANCAAPYIHPRLASTTLKGDHDHPVAVTFVDNIPDNRTKNKT